MHNQQAKYEQGFAIMNPRDIVLHCLESARILTVETLAVVLGAGSQVWVVCRSSIIL